MATPLFNANGVEVLMFGYVELSDLQKYFSKFGPVSCIDTPYFKPDDSRTHSYGTIVTFTTSKAALLSCSVRDHHVEGFRIQVSKSSNPTPSELRPAPANSSVFGTVKVSMFNGQVDESYLCSLFRPYVTASTQPKITYIADGDPPYAYIEFDDPKTAKEASEAVHMHRCCNNRVLIKARLYESRNRSIIVPQKPVEIDANPTSWNWSQGSQNVTRKNVYPPGTEWTEVENLFHATMPRATIVSIERIMNETIYEEYKRRKQTMEDKGKCLNEKQLFHGSETTEPRVIYESDVGFDLRYSKAGRLGKGAYFAKNSSYSNHYSYKINGNRQLFLAVVLTGETCQKTEDDRSLVEAPCKPGTRERYDSVSAYFSGSDIFVVYKLDMACPTHLITYKMSS